MGYTNPLADLPSAPALLKHPLQKRLALALLFRQLRADANTRAEDAWARRNGDMAEFHRALSTYARHMAHLLEQENPLRVRPSRLTVEPLACAPGDARNPILRLPAVQAILGRSVDDRRILAMLIRDLGTAASAEADNSWLRRKAPMAVYWSGVAKHARRVSRLLTRDSNLARTKAAHSTYIASQGPVFDLAALINDSVRAEDLADSVC